MSRRILQEPAILHENTPEFNHELLERLLGAQYIVWSSVISAIDMGTPCERSRRLTWLIHKTQIPNFVEAPLPWSRESWFGNFSRTVDATWKEFFQLASDQEILDELRWAASRPDCVNKGVKVVQGMDFRTVFNGQERDFESAYMELPFAEDSVLSLMQDPNLRCSYTRGSVYLGTVIKSNWPQFSPHFRRWMMGRETLSTNLIIVYNNQRIHGESSPFLYNRSAFGFPARKRAAMFEQAGDTMNHAMMGIAFAWFHTQRRNEVENVPSLLLRVGRALRKRDSKDCDGSDDESAVVRSMRARV